MRRWSGIACLLWAGIAHGGEPPADPILRIDPGMHTAPIWHIAVDSRARWLVTVSTDKTARIWDIASGRLQSVLRPPIGPNSEGRLYAVAMSPDGSVVALGGWTQSNGGRSQLAPEGQAICLFDRGSGRMVRRIDGLPGVIFGLAYSPDGRFLVATLAGSAGIRVFKADTGDFVAEDTDYGDDSYVADVSRDGRVVTSSDDGFVRLYRLDKSGLRPLTKAAAPGGKRPFGVRFSPDGQLIAVGFKDSIAVNVLDGSTLALRYAPESQGGHPNATLSSVGWSVDGQFLYATGALESRNNVRVVRQWPQAGQGRPRDALAATNTVMDLRPLPDGSVAFASGNPDWGILDSNGQRKHVVEAPTADLRDFDDGFLVSRDARTVRFSFKDGGDAPARFNVDEGLQPDDATAPPLAAPRTEAPGLAIAHTRSGAPAQLNGQPLPVDSSERSHSVAIAPDGERFALATQWAVYLFDRSGRKLWRAAAPDAVWAVNVSGDAQTVVTANADGTIRWYDIRDGREKLAFFPHADGKRWVAWTPSGYYQASPGGEDLIGWHINRGRDASADFFPASRLRDRFNRPDIVARALGAPSETDALRLANSDNGRKPETSKSVVQAVLPPVVEIVAPQDGASVREGSVTIRYSTRVPSDAPVTGLRARVNGQQIKLPDARGLTVVGTGDAKELTIPVPQRDSEIQLFAENKNGVSSPATVHLVWSGARNASAAADTYKPKLYVLAVGVSKYANANYDLGLASKDARDFADVLIKQKGALYEEVQVRLLTDAEATKDSILDGLEWLQHQVTAHDVGMMFLAGHGTNDNSGKYYFLPYNADVEKLLRTGVPQSDIRDTLSSLAGKAVFFVDTCHSGNALGTAKTRGLDNDINGFVNDLASAENGVVVFTASTGRQLSLEDPAWGNGAFTKAVVEGLGGKADFQHSGRITLKALDYYVAERVKQLTGGKQSPVSIAPSGVPDFPVAIAAPNR
jgi:WD40 repeat protein